MGAVNCNCNCLNKPNTEEEDNEQTLGKTGSFKNSNKELGSVATKAKTIKSSLVKQEAIKSYNEDSKKQSENTRYDDKEKSSISMNINKISNSMNTFNSKPPLEIINEFHAGYREDNVDSDNDNDIDSNSYIESSRELSPRECNQNVLSDVLISSNQLVEVPKPIEIKPEQDTKVVTTAVSNKPNTVDVRKSTTSLLNTCAWKNMIVTSFIPEALLVDDSDCNFVLILAILFSSQLYKYTPNLKNIAQKYNPRFMTISSSEIRSKENYLKMQKPLNVIPLFKIAKINRFYPNEKTKEKHFYFYINLFENDEMNLGNNSINLSKIADESSKKTNFQLNSDNSEEKYNKELNDLINISLDTNEAKQNKKHPKRMSLINNNEGYGKFNSNKTHLSEILTSSNFMMFTSNYENVTNQWLCVIQYLTSK